MVPCCGLSSGSSQTRLCEAMSVKASIALPWLRYTWTHGAGDWSGRGWKKKLADPQRAGHLVQLMERLLCSGCPSMGVSRDTKMVKLCAHSGRHTRTPAQAPDRRPTWQPLPTTSVDPFLSRISSTPGRQPEGQPGGLCGEGPVPFLFQGHPEPSCHAATAHFRGCWLPASGAVGREEAASLWDGDHGVCAPAHAAPRGPASRSEPVPCGLQTMLPPESKEAHPARWPVQCVATVFFLEGAFQHLPDSQSPRNLPVWHAPERGRFMPHPKAHRY